MPAWFWCGICNYFRCNFGACLIGASIDDQDIVRRFVRKARCRCVHQLQADFAKRAADVLDGEIGVLGRAANIPDLGGDGTACKIYRVIIAIFELQNDAVISAALQFDVVDPRLNHDELLLGQFIELGS